MPEFQDFGLLSGYIKFRAKGMGTGSKPDLAGNKSRFISPP